MSRVHSSVARLTLLVLVALLAVPGTASAAFVELRRTPSWTFTYTADPGERNALVVTKEDGYLVRDSGAVIRTGENCSYEGSDVVCRLPAGTIVRTPPTGTVDLGEENDIAWVAPDFQLLGGPGDDQLTGGVRMLGGPGADIMTATDYTTLDYSGRAAGVRVTFDDLPNDGEPGERDNVRGRFARVEGGAGDDLLSPPSEMLPGGAMPWVTGNGGDDRIVGGPGPDRLWGEAGDDIVEGGGGGDELTGDAGADRIRGGPGTDGFFTGGSADVTIVPDDQPGDGAPGEGDDIGSDVENFATGAGDDHIVGTDGPNRIQAGQGDDTILAGEGDDDIHPGAADSDVVDGGPGRDSIRYPAEEGDTLRMRDGEADSFMCFPFARPQLEVDAADEATGCASSLRVSSRFHKLRPSRRDAVSLRAACDELLPRPCRGEMRLIARTRGTVLARGLYDVAPEGRRSIRLRLTSRGKAALRRRGRIPMSVAIRPADVSFLFPQATIGRGALVR